MIVNATSSLQEASQLFFQQTSNSEPGETNQENANRFGAAFQITLSPEAQSLYQNVNDVNLTDEEISRRKDMNAVIKDVLTGVAEHLEIPLEIGKEGSDKITKAGEAFLKELLAVVEEAKNKPMSNELMERLIKADDKFHSVVDTVYSQTLQESAQGNEDESELMAALQTLLARENRTDKSLFESSTESNIAPQGPANQKSKSKINAQILLLQAQLKAKKAELKSAAAEDVSGIKSAINQLETKISGLKMQLKTK